MVKVFVASTVTEAHFAKTLLAEHGIRSEVRNEANSQARFGAVGDIASLPSVWIVDDSRADEARALLARHRGGPSWLCGSCDEENGAAFEVCWKCGTSRPP